MIVLKLIRPINLLLLALIQFFVEFGLINPILLTPNLSTLQFSLLCVSTLCIAAGGNIINDIYDVEIDLINKPSKVLIGTKISEKNAVRWYILFTGIGVCLGFYLANVIDRPGFAAMFVIISALLYLYASYFKGILLLGNIIISLLVSMSIILIGLFELIPNLEPDNVELYGSIFKIILIYALFAFQLNFIREIVKDIQDVNGDKQGRLNTLPIALGRKRAASIVFWIGILTTLSIIGYMYICLYNIKPLLLYFLIFVLAPLFYFSVQSWNAEKTKDFAFLSFLLKLIMFLGMCSLLLYRYITI